MRLSEGVGWSVQETPPVLRTALLRLSQAATKKPPSSGVNPKKAANWKRLFSSGCCSEDDHHRNRSWRTHVAHGDEAESARAAGFAVHDEVGFSDRAVLGEERVQVLFGGLEGKISHVQFHIYLVEVMTSQRRMKCVRRARMSYRWERIEQRLPKDTTTWLQREAM